MKIFARICACFVFIAGISLFNVGNSSAITDKGDEVRQLAGIDIQSFEQQEPTPPPAVAGENTNFELPVAHNPGLILGAVILVLIIIGGVIINSGVFKKK